jgi:hypothetical protein
MADFILRAGIEFRPRDIDTRAIRDAVGRTIANTVLNIDRVRVNQRAVRQQIANAVRNVSVTLNSNNFRINENQLTNTLRRALQAASQNLQVDLQTPLQQAVNRIRIRLTGRNFIIDRRSVMNQIKQALAGGGALNVSPNVNLGGAQGQLGSFNTLINQTGTNLNNLGTAFAQGGANAEGFGSRIAQITARFTTYLVSLRAVLAAQQAFTNSLQVIFDFDAALSSLQRVLQDTPQQLAAVSDGIFEIARATGRGFEDVTTSLNNFVRQGISTEEALIRTRDALVAVNVTELDANNATRFLTSSIRVFANEVRNGEEALDILVTTADNAATNAGEVGQAFLRSASAPRS